MIDYFPAPSFRFKQDKTINAIESAFEDNDYKYILAELPMGIGKSLIGYTAACFYGSAYLCTPQKSLQNQYLKEKFKNKEFPLSKIQGRGNYICLNSNKSCSTHCNKNNGLIERCQNALTTNFEYGVSHAATSAKRGELYWNSYTRCPYLAQKVDAMNAKILVPNYKFLILETNYIGDLGQRELLVSDEAHNLEKNIYDFVETRLTQDDIETLNLIDTYKGEEVKDWIDTLKQLVGKDKKKNKNGKEEKEDFNAIINKNDGSIPYLIAKIEVEIKAENDKPKIVIDNYKIFQLNMKKDNLVTMRNKMKFIIEKYKEEPDNWIVEVNRLDDRYLQSLVFKPIYIGKWAKEIYFSKGKRNLLMTGTVVNFKKFMDGLGLEFDDVKQLRLAPIFPPQNQPTYNLNIGWLNKHALDIKNTNNKLYDVVVGVDLALSCFPNDKGIIHTTNFTLTNYIKEHSKFGDRIIVHDSKNRMEMMDYHIESDEPTVLCSPSFYEGADLKDDLSRFQVIPKVPYPYIGKDDKRITKLIEHDPEIVNYLTKIRLIQTKARSIRSPNDHAVTITLDTNFKKFQKDEEEDLELYFNRYVMPKNDFIKEHKEQIIKFANDSVMAPNWLNFMAENALKI